MVYIIMKMNKKLNVTFYFLIIYILYTNNLHKMEYQFIKNRIIKLLNQI